MRGRIRTIKPEAFTDEKLWDLEEEIGAPVFRAFVGLWTQADREGRFEWRPRALKAAILPYWDGDFSRVLDALATRGFVRKYSVRAREYGLVANFCRHQSINNREDQSQLPAPPDESEEPIDPTSSTREPRVSHASPTRGPRRSSGTERNGTELRVVRENARARDDASPTGEPCDAAEPGPDRREPDAPPLERARLALVRGYARRYEAATEDAWMGAPANGQAIGAVAAWCAADPKRLEQRAEDVLEGMFGDPWMAERRWPWGPVAKDAAKYAELGRAERKRAAKAKRRAELQAQQQTREFAKRCAAEAEAIPPPLEALEALKAFTRSFGAMPAKAGKAGHDERRAELERQRAHLAELRAAGGACG